jgi:hypothetical protein
MLRDVTLKRPLDGTLLADLYPNIAVRKTISAYHSHVLSSHPSSYCAVTLVRSS